VKGETVQIVRGSDRHLGRSVRVFELPRSLGARIVELPLAWARPYEDVVVAFDRFTPTNWQVHLASTDGEVLLAFPWHDHADRLLLLSEHGELPIQADEEAWTALVGEWWAWVKAEGPYVYVAECNSDELRGIRRPRRLERRAHVVAIDDVEFSWSRVPRVAYDRAWQDAIDTCRAGWPSPVGEWISEALDDRRLRLQF
jgi:hypothetical protein